MKLLYANGCSWTEGTEIPNDSKLPHCQNSMYYKSWPYRLSQKLHIPLCINEGAGAGSNDRIYRKTTEYIVKYINSGRNPKDLLIVIGWTTCERTEVSALGTYIRVTTAGAYAPLITIEKSVQNDLDEYQKAYYRVYDDVPSTKRFVLMMITLRMLCKSHGIKYYDFIAIGPEPIDYMNISEKVYNSQLTNLHNISWNEYCDKNFQSRYEHGHPTSLSHDNWASVLAENIKQL